MYYLKHLRRLLKTPIYQDSEVHFKEKSMQITIIIIENDLSYMIIIFYFSIIFWKTYN